MNATAVAMPRAAVRRSRWSTGLHLAALGVVFGDIGTSPLYALRECFHPAHGIAVDRANVLGILSLVVWSLVLVVAVKYVVFVLRADSRGEGGVLALLASTLQSGRNAPRRRAVLVTVGILGAALLYGDGVITPCITVMGAMEGLHVATGEIAQYVVPLSVAVLVLLFSFQRAGSGRVGAVLGPIMLVWFAVLLLLGLRGIAAAPEVLACLLPCHADAFLAAHGWRALPVLGAVFLVVTGAEALYADLGHFGRRAITNAWFAVAMPALLVNYLGQGALLLREPAAARNPFFLLAPDWAVYALVALATLASVVASQALIAGTFSLTVQAMQLGYLPRLEVRHTSPQQRGQVYLPLVNRMLLAACVVVCVGFGSASAMASAYGIAVTLTMVTTTLLFFFAAPRALGWSVGRTAVVCGTFAAIELVFFAANLLKVADGGWLPLVVAAAVFGVMATWRTGQRLLRERHRAQSVPMATLLDGLRAHVPHRVAGTAVYMAADDRGAPPALLHNLEHNKVLHERVVLLTIAIAEEPHVPLARRLAHEALPLGIHRLIARYGFMDHPEVVELLERWHAHTGSPARLADTTFFLGRETIVTRRRRPRTLFFPGLFAFLLQNRQSATAYFGLPANRVVELGAQVEL